MQSNNKFRDSFRKLDLKTRNVIAFSGFDLFIERAVSQYSLDKSQLTNLSILTINIILGIEKKEDFILKISELLKLNQGLSQAIANEINKKIINNIENLYANALLLSEEYLLEEEEEYIEQKICSEIRKYEDFMDPQILTKIISGEYAHPETENLILYIKKRPAQIQKKIFSGFWLQKIIEIGKNYSLTKENIKIITGEVLLVLLKNTYQKDLLQNLKDETSIPLNILRELTDYLIKIITESEKYLSISNSENKDAGLPMVEDGEVAHSVQPMSEGEKEEIIKKTEERMPTEVVFGAYVPRPNDNSNEREEKTPSTPLKNNYPGGVDPYREPLT